jgi:Tol biopolymer transport system component
VSSLVGLRRRSALAILVSVTALSFLLVSGQAHSAHPGANGKIAFSRCENASCGLVHIWTMDPDGANEVAIPSGVASDDPAWSPNGQKLAFQECGTSSCATAGITVTNPDGSGTVHLTPTAGPGYDDRPSFSPDGSKIAFTHCQPGVLHCAIYLMGADGAAPHQLTTTLGSNEDQESPAFSPDGSEIVFQDCLGGGCFIALVPSAGGSPVQISHPSVSDESPDWSPDGSRIVFDRCCDADGNSQIFVMGADGGNPTAITTPPADQVDFDPEFSPDGSLVVFERLHPGAPTNDGQISSVPAGGGAVATLSGPGADQGDFRPTWQPSVPIFASGPTLSGKAVNGQTLTATAGSVSGGGTTSLAFLRCDRTGNGCLPIPGASAARLRARTAASSLSYKLTTVDIGHVIKVRQTQSNAVGASTADSAASVAVAPDPARCSNVFVGTAKRDRLVGTKGGDRISGGRGNDRISGLGGADCLSGGAGNDRISGGAGNDTLSGGAGNDMISGGGGRNKVSAGSGNDRINVVNHKKDIVNCGKGRDSVRADRIDRLRGCERVKRSRR